MPTILDVARKARVSVMTVSRTLNTPEKVSEATRRRIHHVMETLGYQPSHIARSLVRKRTNTVGIIMPDIKNTFFNSWFRCVEHHARAVNYNLLLCNSDESPEHEMENVRLMLAQRVDGIIIVPHAVASVEYIRRSQRPYVLVDRVFPGLPSDYVTTDHRAGAFDATQHLINLGHRKIAVLRGPGELYPDIERHRGFCDAMKKHRLGISPDLVRNCEFQEMHAWEATRALLSREPRPTAIFSFNSLMTAGAIRAIQELHMSIPGDVSLLSFDEIPGQTVFTPTITYVQQPIEELGLRATRAIMERIQQPGRREFTRLLLPPMLIAGNSCGTVQHRKTSPEP